MTRKHWSERLTCRCGASFSSATAEAMHRHSYPALCRPRKTNAEALSRAEAGPLSLPQQREAARS